LHKGSVVQRVVVESQTISQITVEEITESENLEKQIPARLRPRVISWQRLVVAGIVIIILGIGGYLFLYGIATQGSRFPFERISITRLTTKGTVSRAALSSDGKLFVYSIPEGELESLWLGHVDGGEPVQIRPPADHTFLAMKFTPDGSAIYYSVSDPHNGRVLYRIPVFGGAPQRIQDNFSGLTFSSNGRQFAFLRFDPNRNKSVLMRADADGGNAMEITVMPSDIASTWHSPAWSSDGSAIVVAASIGVDVVKLFVVKIADGSITALTAQTWRGLDGITWLKNGAGLVLVGLGKNSLHSQLWFISFPGGEARPLITDLNDYGYVTSLADDNSLLALQGISESNIWVAPAGNLKGAKQITFDSPGRNDGWNGLAWTNDGRIVYAADDGDGRTLWIINGGGGKPKELIPNGGLNSYPSITADGRYLVFQSNRSGHFAIWRSDLDGGNMTQLTGEQSAAQPSVSPDGRWVLYNSNFDGIGELFRISIQGGEPFRLTDKPAGWALVSPDSKSVACQLDADGKMKLAILSLASGQILKSFDLPRLANPRLGVHWTPDGQSGFLSRLDERNLETKPGWWSAAASGRVTRTKALFIRLVAGWKFFRLYPRHHQPRCCPDKE
jgi:Tol biopolymer transport system component